MSIVRRTLESELKDSSFSIYALYIVLSSSLYIFTLQTLEVICLHLQKLHLAGSFPTVGDSWIILSLSSGGTVELFGLQLNLHSHFFLFLFPSLGSQGVFVCLFVNYQKSN